MHFVATDSSFMYCGQRPTGRCHFFYLFDPIAFFPDDLREIAGVYFTRFALAGKAERLTSFYSRISLALSFAEC